jgi:cysteine desulfurase/selenocysteine lyase
MTSTGSAVPARDVALDAAAIRQDFPLLRPRVRSKPLVYLDNAATTQKPQTVIDRVVRYYAEENANVHRGVHWLSERATEAYENARATVGRFLNARDSREIVFVRGTTEAINLVASTYGRAHVSRGDEIVLSAMEHHSNIVPWQLLCEQQGARLRVIPVSDAGELDLEAYATLLNDRTRIVSVVHVSNALGTINPVEQIVRIAAASPCSSTVRRRPRTCASTCRRSAVISTRSPDTRFLVRPASVCCTGPRRCWKRCRRMRAAAT